MRDLQWKKCEGIRNGKMRDLKLNKMRDLKWNKLNRLFNLKQFKTVPKLMFDDNGSVLSKMRENGIVAINSLKVNKRLA